jgi:hypothetical protein
MSELPIIPFVVFYLYCPYCVCFGVWRKELVCIGWEFCKSTNTYTVEKEPANGYI